MRTEHTRGLAICRDVVAGLSLWLMIGQCHENEFDDCDSDLQLICGNTMQSAILQAELPGSEPGTKLWTKAAMASVLPMEIHSPRGIGQTQSFALKMNSNLPSERDFDPYGGDLDAQCAWRNFGGLTLEEATRRFSERPEIYHEDFMHMGGRAFNYYYPAIDRFLRDTLLIVGDEIDDRQSWVLPQCIRCQFEGKNLPYVRNRKREVIELCEFMLSNIELFAGDWDPPSEIESQWTQLKFHLQNLR